MMKKIYLLMIVMGLVSCEDFLDTQSYKEKNNGNFPMNSTDVEQLVTGIYGMLNEAQSAADSYSFMLSELASDECFGGGGINDKKAQATDHLLMSDEGAYAAFWKTMFKGIGRANEAISVLSQYPDTEWKSQLLGECHFLRGYYYFELAQIFENIPIITHNPDNVEDAKEPLKQATPDELYSLIASDLKLASDIMPSVKWNELEYGKVSRWAAEALLARVYLFYTGFYQKEYLPLQSGAKIEKTEIISKLQDCIDNSGHQLVADFRSLWPYSNKATLKDIRNMNEGERPNWFTDDIVEWKRDGENSEQIFSINFRYYPNYQGTKYTNQVALFGSFRSIDNDIYEKGRPNSAFPLSKGWGFAPVATKFYENWNPEDKRRDYSVMYVDPTTYDSDQQMEASGYWSLKNTSISCYSGDKRLDNFASSTDYWGDGISSNYQVSICQSLCLIRFADVLLMQAELKEDMSYVDELRIRAGLTPILGYSLKALQEERAAELAFEGVRWGDIRRWHIAEEMLATQVGAKIYNVGVEKKMVDQKAGYVQRYKETRGFFPIPKAEIDLSNGTLKQNKGWDGDVRFTSWQE